MRQPVVQGTTRNAENHGPPGNADETAARLEAAQRRIAELEEAVAARDHFVAVVGHEMRNPMVPILLALDRARRAADAGDAARLRQSLATLDLSVGAFVRRATQVLDISRFNAGQFRLEPEPTDLTALVRGVVADYVEMARHVGCPLGVAAPEGVRLECDRGAVQQILENLLSNALKYGAGTPVEVRLERHASGVRLSVCDGGPGIDAADRARIFERFERVARRGSQGGFGIGLWLVGQLAKAMGAAVTVDGAPGQGTIFSLDLPERDTKGG